MSDPKSIHSIQGHVLRRGEDGYEQARLDAVWNARKPDRYPDLIVIAEHESDVVKAVGLAKADCGSASAPVGTAGWETGSATVDC